MNPVGKLFRVDHRRRDYIVAALLPYEVWVKSAADRRFCNLEVRQYDGMGKPHVVSSVPAKAELESMRRAVVSLLPLLERMVGGPDSPAVSWQYVS